MTVFVPDISNWQGNVNMSTWAAMGVEAVIAKAQEGRDGEDKLWATNKKKIPDHGFIPGAYAYMNHTFPAGQQCGTFLNRVPGNWIHALDVEAPGPLDVDGWVNEYRKHYPKKVLLLYTNEPMWHNRSLVKVTNAASRYAPCAIWIAGAYRGAYQAGTDDFRKIWSRVPAGADGGLPQLGFSEYAIMQYSGSASVPGVSGPCDMGVAGSVQVLKNLAAENGSTDDMSQADIDAINKHIDTGLKGVRDYLDQRLDDITLGKGNVSSAVFSGRFGKNPDGSDRTAGQLLLEASNADNLLELVKANDSALQAGVDALNAKIGSGNTGQLSKQDVLEAVQQIVGGTRFVPEANPQ